MFQAFSTGKEDDPGNGWTEQPQYAPGRWYAHALPSASSSSALPESSASRASSVHNLPFPSSASKPGPRVTHARQRSRPRAFVKPFFSRSRQEDDGPRSPLLDGFLGGFGSLGGGVEATVEERDEEEEEGGWLRPGRRKVERWMDSWWRRWAVLVATPCLIIWVWCSIPFPVSDPYKEEPPWHLPWPPTTDPPLHSFFGQLAHLPWLSVHVPTSLPVAESSFFGLERRAIELGRTDEHAQKVWEIELVDTPTASTYRGQEASAAEGGGAGGYGDDQDLPVDANFWFFLVVYYGAYLAIALIFVTKLFDLYRLNWWPSSLGGSVSYTFFWTLTLLIGFLLHHFDLDGFGRRTRSRRARESDEWDWERKTTWVLLAFAAMCLPALACVAKLRADRRNSYRRSLTAAQKTFLERQLAQRMPRSYRRFLWFLATLGLSLLALIVGQGFATVYLSTLPHNNIEGVAYVWLWIMTVNVLNVVSSWILQRKVRSQALFFCLRFYFFLVYHVFYRNLFARLRSPDQAAWITLLSSSVVIVVYPLTMSKAFWRILRWTVGLDVDWEDYAAEKGRELYLRNLSEVVTMVAFLGWLSILHWGPNKAIYPFFAFDSPEDPYTYRLTLTASLIIFATELFSSYIARAVCWLCYGVDVTNLGLDQFREHPELVVACIFTACHVLSDMLFFLVKLNFR
ncbi:hypothetical protein JCM8547_008788 [Rhodosporidiobolus lusitaniae]